MTTTPTTWITGAAGALGGTVAEHLAGLGHRLVLVDLARGQERMAALAARLPGSHLALGFDTSTAAAWSEARATAEAKLGPATGAVLVAGGWQGGSPLHGRSDDAVWDAMKAMNLDSVHRALRCVLPGMVERKRGSIVAIGSRAAVLPGTSAGAAEYAATKAAVVALCQAVAAEVLEHGVRLNCVLPSTIDTPANRAAMPNVDPAKWVTAGSLAENIAFLLSDASRDVSGLALPVYGRA